MNRGGKNPTLKWHILFFTFDTEDKFVLNASLHAAASTAGTRRREKIGGRKSGGRRSAKGVRIDRGRQGKREGARRRGPPGVVVGRD